MKLDVLMGKQKAADFPTGAIYTGGWHRDSGTGPVGSGILAPAQHNHLVRGAKGVLAGR